MLASVQKPSAMTQSGKEGPQGDTRKGSCEGKRVGGNREEPSLPCPSFQTRCSALSPSRSSGRVIFRIKKKIKLFERKVWSQQFCDCTVPAVPWVALLSQLWWASLPHPSPPRQRPAALSVLYPTLPQWPHLTPPGCCAFPGACRSRTWRPGLPSCRSSRQRRTGGRPGWESQWSYQGLGGAPWSGKGQSGFELSAAPWPQDLAASSGEPGGGGHHHERRARLEGGRVCVPHHAVGAALHWRAVLAAPRGGDTQRQPWLHLVHLGPEPTPIIKKSQINYLSNKL